MPKRDIVVVAASAGGIEAIQDLLSGLPSEYPGSILIVLHMPASGGRALTRIIARATSLHVELAAEGMAIAPGTVYVCASDHHLLVGHGHLHVRRGPREHGHRPAADPLFRSAAAYYGPQVVGVVLSGSLSDGTAGLAAIRWQGGMAVVQDPEDALYDGMPRSALDYVGADWTGSAKEIGPLLARVALDEVDGGETEDRPAPDVETEVALMEEGIGTLDANHPGRPSPWPCPDCSGVLWEIDDGTLLRFRCRVGHAWSAESLLQEQGEGVEAALWMGLRALEDRADLSRTLAERAVQSGRHISATRFRQDLNDMARSIEILRRLLNSDRTAPADLLEPAAGGSPNE